MILRMVCYDIENDHDRQKIAKRLESLGFYRLQLSVFCGCHNEAQWATCKTALGKLVKQLLRPSDKLYIINLSQEQFKHMHAWGEKPDFDLILDKKRTLWI